MTESCMSDLIIDIEGTKREEFVKALFESPIFNNSKIITESHMYAKYSYRLNLYSKCLEEKDRIQEWVNMGYIYGIGECLGYSLSRVISDINKCRKWAGLKAIEKFE